MSEIDEKLKKLEEEKKKLEAEREEAKRLEGTDAKAERVLTEEEKLERKLFKEEKKEETLESRRRNLLNEISKRNNIYFAIAVLVIVLITIYFRVDLLQYYGFFEPDGFYHFSVIRAAVAHNFVVPKVLGISGWPVHARVTEPVGLYWVTLFPYFFVRFFGISYYTVMRLVPILFGIFDVLGTCLLARRLSKDRFFGLLAMLLVALSLGDAARTSGTVYRGDGFITIFLILAIYFTLKLFERGNRNSKIAFSLLAGASLTLGSFVWNGAPFAIAVYVMGFALVLAAAFIIGNRSMLDDSAYMLATLAVWYLLAKAMRALALIGDQTFTGKYFIMLYVFMLVGFAVAKLLLGKKESLAFMKSAWNKLLLVAAFIIIVVIVIYALAPAFVYQVFVANGFIVTNGFAATIEELQPPTPCFFFASFGPVIYTTPMTLAMYESAEYYNPHCNQTYYSQTHHSLIVPLFLVLLLTSGIYLFLQVESKGGFFDSRAWIKRGMSVPMLMLISYLAVTAYLQMHAVRFNSLVSIPIALFSAYTIYWLATYFRKYKYIALGIIFAFLIYTFAIDMTYSSGLSQADNINPSFISALQWMKNNTPPNAVVLTLWPDGSVVEGVANRTSVMDSVGAQNSAVADPFAAWLFNSSDDPQMLTGNLTGKPNYLLVRYSWLSETGGIYLESGIRTNASEFAYVFFNKIGISANSTEQLYQFSSTSTSYEARLIVQHVNGTQRISAYAVLNNGFSPFSYIAFYNQENDSFSIIKQTSYNATNNNMLLVEYSPTPNPSEPVNITGAIVFAPGIASSNMIKFLYFCNSNYCLWNNNQAALKLVYANSDTKIFQIFYNTTSTS